MLVLVIILGGCSAQFPEGIANRKEPGSSPVGEEDALLPSQQVSSSSPTGVGENVNVIDGMTIIFIPSGTFEMGLDAHQSSSLCQILGSDCSPDQFADEAPVHLVELESFWIYQTEVTNAQYRHCVEDEMCPSPAILEFFHDPIFEDHPVVYVDWYSAESYCKYSGGRLPSEAEWEKAARGKDGRLFPWGEDAVCGKSNLKGCTQGLTTPVGAFPEGASPYGVLDMAGNVTEWVADWYSEEYYQVSPPFNPTGPSEGEMRVARGGSWKNPFLGVRSTNRTANYPEVFSTGVGFRCVIDPEE